MYNISRKAGSESGHTLEDIASSCLFRPNYVFTVTAHDIIME